MKISVAVVVLGVLLTGCADPYEKPAKPEQIEKFQKVLEMYPSLKADYKQAEADGVITKGELKQIADKAVAIKESR